MDLQDYQEMLDERIAIMIHDGGLSEEEAIRLATKDIENYVLSVIEAS